MMEYDLLGHISSDSTVLGATIREVLGKVGDEMLEGESELVQSVGNIKHGLHEKIRIF